MYMLVFIAWSFIVDNRIWSMVLVSTSFHILLRLTCKCGKSSPVASYCDAITRTDASMFLSKRMYSSIVLAKQFATMVNGTHQILFFTSRKNAVDWLTLTLEIVFPHPQKQNAERLLRDVTITSGPGTVLWSLTYFKKHKTPPIFRVSMTKPPPPVVSI